MPPGTGTKVTTLFFCSLQIGYWSLFFTIGQSFPADTHLILSRDPFGILFLSRRRVLTISAAVFLLLWGPNRLLTLVVPHSSHNPIARKSPFISTVTFCQLPSIHSAIISTLFSWPGRG